MNENTIMNRYAAMRERALKNNAPKMYAAMIAKGMLEENLSDVQEIVSNYVDMKVEKYKLSDEYIKADEVSKMRLVNMTVFEAEDEAYRMWIAVADEDDDYDDDDEYEENKQK